MTNINIKKHMIISEEIFFSQTAVKIVTVLGSAVAVTIFDRVKLIGGLVHFLEPEWNGIGLKSCRYGDVGTFDLINRFIETGSKREDLIANIIGGATLGTPITGNLPIGLKNVQSAKKVLDQEHIAIDHVEVGKEIGRYLSFNTATGEIQIKQQKKS